MFRTFNEDRYYIERKYHNPEKEFDPFSRMKYHGEGYIEESGLSEQEILKGLEELEPQIKNLPHHIARAKAIEYVLQNERLYINEHDYFVGLDSLSRLANTVTFSKWRKESEKNRDASTIQKANDFNDSGAVMIWTDYDHVVPDWKSLMDLGFAGILERARKYRQMHKLNNTLTEEADALFEGIEIQYTAIINLLDRMYNVAKEQEFEKQKK